MNDTEIMQPFDYAFRAEWVKSDLGPNQCFVIEKTSLALGSTKFGPMPRDIMGLFIGERRRLWEWTLKINRDFERTAPYISHVVADQAGIKSAPPQETALKTGEPVAEGGAEPPMLGTVPLRQLVDDPACGWREETDDEFRKRVLAFYGISPQGEN